MSGRVGHIGWVPSEALRGRVLDAGGTEVFTEADFSWTEAIEPYKAIIVAGVNKVHRENSRCKTIDPSSAYISGARGTPDAPVFFVTCGSGRDIFNAFFSKSEIEAGAPLAAMQHVDRDDAVAACIDYAKSQAAHPSTVDFSTLLDLVVENHANGNTTVLSTFTAKNTFNLELKYNIRCLSNAQGLFEGHIVEGR